MGLSLGTGLAIAGAGSLAGGILGSQASSSAANKQADAAKQATAAQLGMFGTLQSETAPYRQFGNEGLATLASYLGLPDPVAAAGQQQIQPPNQAQFIKPGGAFDQAGYNAALQQYQQQISAPLPSNQGNANFGTLLKPFTLADVPNDPGYQFATQQANQQLENSALARGGMLSGNFATALQQQNQNMGFQQENQAFNQYWQQRGNIANLLGQATQLGQAGVGQSTGVGASVIPGISSTIQGVGNAQAAGTIGSANAISGALGGIGSLGVQYPLLNAYSNFLNQGSMGTGGMQGLTANTSQLFPNAPTG